MLCLQLALGLIGGNSDRCERVMTEMDSKLIEPSLSQKSTGYCRLVWWAGMTIGRTTKLQFVLIVDSLSVLGSQHTTLSSTQRAASHLSLGCKYQ